MQTLPVGESLPVRESLEDVSRYSNKSSLRTMFIEDDRLPLDVLRKNYSDSRHALCCLECGYEADFNPVLAESIGRPLALLLHHSCEADDASQVGRGD